jgi:hypothetical protein
MESPSERSGTIIGIWFAAACICFPIMIYGAVTKTNVNWLFALTIIATLAFTLLFWFMPDPGARAALRQKSKRQPGDQLALLKELLDEDELAAFKTALQDRLLDSAASRHDGELPLDADTLEALDSIPESRRGAQR